MRTARLLAGIARAAATVGIGLAAAAPAYAGDTGRLAIEPRTVAPGSSVTATTGACDAGASGGAGGTVTGDASAVGSGSFTLVPEAREGDASGQFRVPPSAVPGTYEIVAKCPKGGTVTGDLVVTLTSTASAVPPAGSPAVSAPGAPPPGAVDGQVSPRGHVETGLGGALGPEPVQTTAGLAALALAAAAGTWLLHRRAKGIRL